MTYAEEELCPLGFHLISEKVGWCGVQEVVLGFGHLMFLFVCVCPAYPKIRALGCSLHRGSIGDSWPIEIARKIPAVIGM